MLVLEHAPLGSLHQGIVEGGVLDTITPSSVVEVWSALLRALSWLFVCRLEQTLSSS